LNFKTAVLFLNTNYNNYFNPIIVYTILGSLSEPKHFPGLAHLCEHMLLLNFKKFMEQNGGKYNGNTTNDYTNYYFSIENDLLQNSLKELQYTYFCFFLNTFL